MKERRKWILIKQYMDGKTMGVGEINLELGDVKGKGLRQNPDEHKQKSKRRTKETEKEQLVR